MALQAYEDGKTSMYIQERKASIREFYGGYGLAFILRIIINNQNQVYVGNSQDRWQ